MDAARTLLSGIVDYAGLFPPASATMEQAVAEYARQRESGGSWMLAAFVVPVVRLGEFADAADGPLAASQGPWPLSVLVGADYREELDALAKWVRDQAPGRVGVAALEHRPATPEAVADVASRAAGVELFLELPWDADLRPWVEAVRAAGARAKIRCGGVTPDLIPPVDRVAEFLRVCSDAGVGLKFTAGLHHPVRSVHPLTYEADAPTAMMHGFLNVFVAAGLLASGGLSDLDLLAVLEETDSGAFRVGPDGVAWREREVPASGLDSARRSFARSFGSCSFAEPVEDLQQLGML
jgi:hypothetical protein